MIKILTFAPHDNPNTGGGTVEYCKALEDLFKMSSDINISESEILPHNSLLGLKYDNKSLSNYLKSEKPDIIHINGYTSLLTAQLVPLAKQLNIKIVYTAHWHPFYTMRNSWIKKLYFHIFVKPYLKYMDAIIAINNEDYSFFKKFTSKVHLIHHWIRKEVSETHQKKINNQILFVGSLVHPNKGFKYLFNLPENKYRIVCIGKGDAKLRSDMKQYTSVSEEELIKLYSDSSVVVIPSKYEAFSYVALESLCLGTPIVISNSVRIIDHLKDFSGVQIFNRNSPEIFNECINSIIGYTFDNTSILTKFSKQEAHQKYRELYTSL